MSASGYGPGGGQIRGGSEAAVPPAVIIRQLLTNEKQKSHANMAL